MRHRTQVASATDFAPAGATKRNGPRFARQAPAPEAPDTRDRAGARLGMILLLVGGGAFWLTVAAFALNVVR